jgi:hypothetical protein
VANQPPSSGGGILYRTVETYWPIFLRERARVDKDLPIFIKDEFEKILRCGIPEFGFVRTYCYQCRMSGIVAFSLGVVISI